MSTLENVYVCVYSLSDNGWSVCLCSYPRISLESTSVYKQSHTVQAGRVGSTLVYIYPPFGACQHTVETAVAHRHRRTHTRTETHLDMFMVEVLCLRGLSPLSDRLPPACRHLTHRHTHAHTHTHKHNTTGTTQKTHLSVSQGAFVSV